MSLFLSLASAGLDILGGFSQARAAGRQAADETFQAVLSGNLERMQITRQAEEDARLRASELRSVLGSQQAAFGARGVAGGRTAQLIAARSRAAAMREQEMADFQTRMGLQSSEYRQTQTQRAALTAGRAGQLQGGLTVAGGGIDVFRSIQRHKERGEVG